MSRLRFFLVAFLIVTLTLCVISCGGNGVSTPTATATPNPTPTPTDTSTATPTATATPTMPEIDMSTVIEELCNTTKPFEEFYNDKIKPLNATIRWFSDPTLNVREHATAENNVYEDEDGLHQDIRLGNISQDEDIAFIYAHELASQVTFSEGYPEVQNLDLCGNVIEVVSQKLSNMISVPLRDSILAEYGFDVEKEFRRYGPILSFLCMPLEDPLLIHMAAFDYVQIVLYWQNVLGNHGIPSDFDNFYIKCYPDAWEEGRHIYGQVCDIEYNRNNTPEKARTLFQMIIFEYGLGHCIRVT